MLTSLPSWPSAVPTAPHRELISDFLSFTFILLFVRFWCLCEHVHVGSYIRRSEVSIKYLFGRSLPCFLRQVSYLSLNLEPANSLGQLTSKSQVSSCLHVLDTGTVSAHCRPLTLLWVLGIKLRSSCLCDKDLTR